ncbi:hypothetical protein [Candidatus Tisiphia endosymbiont of Nemotelus uliginosus]|uniref:hypothetical protein n=1 Tax=Candidatus Tisiphia endosymbiont of Nemotelus uliginosus TaxID=3077926 RepID=UPI0035C8DADD
MIYNTKEDQIEWGKIEWAMCFGYQIMLEDGTPLEESLEYSPMVLYRSTPRGTSSTEEPITKIPIKLLAKKETKEISLYIKLAKWLNSHFGNNEKPAVFLDETVDDKIPLNRLEDLTLDTIRRYKQMEQDVKKLFFTRNGKIPFCHIEALRQYDKMDKELITLFAQQNNEDFTIDTVDSYINKHFFEITGVARKITHESETPNKQFGDLPAEMQQKVCSYLHIRDIMPDQGITSNVDPIGDLPSPINDSE